MATHWYHKVLIATHIVNSWGIAQRRKLYIDIRFLLISPPQLQYQNVLHIQYLSMAHQILGKIK